MTDNNIIEFDPMVTPRNRVEPDDVLEGAKDKELTDVIIIGKRQNGDGEISYYFASSGGTNQALFWDAEQFQQFILHG